MKKEKSFLSTIHLILGAHIILWLNAGVYGLIRDAVPSIVKYGIVTLWFLIALFRQLQFINRFFMKVLPLVVFILIANFARSLGYVKYWDQYSMLLFYATFLIGLFAYYYYFGTSSELKVLLFIFIADILITAVFTYFALLETPDLVRMSSTSIDHRESVGFTAHKVVGSYGYCYQVALLVPIAQLLFKKFRINGIVKWMIYLFFLLFLFQAQITIALIAYVVLLLICSFDRHNKAPSAVIGRIVLVVGAVVILVNMSSILDFAIQLSSESLGTRLREIQNLFFEQTVGDDMSSRMKLYTETIETFSDNPFYGSFGQGGYGSHSTLLDLLAAFGVFGLLCYSTLLRPMGIVKKDFRKNPDIIDAARLITVVYVALSVINVTITTEICTIYLLMIPLAIKFLSLEKSESIEDSSDKHNPA